MSDVALNEPRLEFAPVGAMPAERGVVYRVWAPEHHAVRVCIENAQGVRNVPLVAEADGYFSALDGEGRAGDRYFFELDGVLRPDPASRYQPHGVEGLSEVVDPAAYRWKATHWRRPPYAGRVIYELHIGTFTSEGTFLAAIKRLDALVDLGVNTIQLMPVADFAGERNWGYDGVMLFAPARCYGTPDDLRALVDAAHVRGLAVILDVVYNHLGACGNVLPAYTTRYFHTERSSIWGQGLDYALPPVRWFFLQNARQWLDDFRFDGLRLDATHAVHDDSTPHIVAEICAAARRRNAWIICEDERNDVSLITPARQGGWGADAVWADDFHHTVRVALTGQQEAHFRNYTGTLHEWVETVEQGWFYDGQYCPNRGRPRGTPAGHIPPERFVVCISNHDQVGNRPLGDRLHTVITPAAYRAVSMLLCFTPYTPMLFMGQEWAADAPFPFFTDLPGEVGAKMREHRLNEFKHYGASYPDDVLAAMPDPQEPATFASAKLDWSQRLLPSAARTLALYTACLQLRGAEAIFQNPSRDRWEVRHVESQLLGLRWRDPAGDWLLLTGTADEELIVTQSEPFTRANEGFAWELVLASNELRFGDDVPQLPWRSDERGFYVRTPGAVLLREKRTG